MSRLSEHKEPPKEKELDYFKMKEPGDYKVRILSEPFMGWEEWIGPGKPLYHRWNGGERPELRDPENKCTHIWAFVVWNYNMKRIQIWRVPQVSIRDALKAFDSDSDLGPLHGYDVKITRKGTLVSDTKYTLKALNQGPVPEDIRKAFKQRRCWLEAYLSNGDPFSKEWDRFTPGCFDQEDAQEETAPYSPTSSANSGAEQLRDLLLGAGLNDVLLEDFINSVASRSGLSFEATAESICKRPSAAFQDNYEKYLSERLSQTDLSA